MPIDKELIIKKLDFLNAHLSAIERMDFIEDAFVENPDIHDLVTFRLQQAVETCIDIAVHIIAALDVPRKETAKDAFLLLGEQKIITKELSGAIGKAADFRNRVVHCYNNFDFHILFQDYKNDVSELRVFGREILEYVVTTS